MILLWGKCENDIISKSVLQYFDRNITKVCFKKTVTIHSTVSLLWIVTIFLKQTLDGRLQGSQTSWKYALFLLVFVHYSLERERLIKDEPHLSILLPRQHAWPSTYWSAIISVGAFSITCYCIFTRFLCLMTAYWLPDDRLMTVWWLPDDCLMTAWWLPDDCLMTAWLLSDDSLCVSFRSLKSLKQ